MIRLTLPRTIAAASSLAGIALTIGAPVLIVGSVAASHAVHPLRAIAIALALVEVVAFLRSPLRYAERTTQHTLVRSERRIAREGVLTAFLSWPYDRWLDRRGYQEVHELLKKSGSSSEYHARFTIPYHATVASLVIAGLMTVVLGRWTAPFAPSFAIIAVAAVVMLGIERTLRPALQQELCSSAEHREKLVREWSNRYERSLTWSLLGGEASEGSSLEATPRRPVENLLDWLLSVIAGLGAVAAVFTADSISSGSPTIFAACIISSLWLFEFSRTVFTYATASPPSVLESHGPSPAPGSSPLHNVVTIGHLEVRPGTHVAIVGPSGSGKSTLLRALMGWGTSLHHPVSIDGIPPTSISEGWMTRHMAWVPSDITYRIGTASDLYYLGREECDEYESWQGLHLPEASTPGSHLSDGQLRRIALARALARHPAILLLDEPTATLDDEGRRAILAALNSFPGTLIVATHDTELAALCSVVVDLSES